MGISSRISCCEDGLESFGSGPDYRRESYPTILIQRSSEDSHSNPTDLQDFPVKH